MEEYSITWRTQWPFIKSLVLFTFLLLVVFYFMDNHKHSAWNSALFICIVFLIEFIPQLSLHLNYYFVNNGDVLRYNTISKEICFIHQNNEFKFHIDDIAEVILYQSVALKKKTFPMNTWDDYNHAVLTLNTGTKITVTSLMVGAEVVIPVDDSKVKVMTNIYRWAKKPSVRLA